MVELQENFPDAVIGLSDHTTTNHACFGAVALRSKYLRKTFHRYLRRKGPDISCSMNKSFD